MFEVEHSCFGFCCFCRVLSSHSVPQLFAVRAFGSFFSEDTCIFMSEFLLVSHEELVIHPGDELLYRGRPQYSRCKRMRTTVCVSTAGFGIEKNHDFHTKAVLPQQLCSLSFHGYVSRIPRAIEAAMRVLLCFGLRVMLAYYVLRNISDTTISQ